MALKKNLPLVMLRINPKDGSYVKAISIVGNPAIESSFIAFSKEANLIFSDDVKRELIGAAMIPDQPIYRNSPESGEYMAVFTAETIREIAQIYAEKGFFNNMNLEHSQDRPAGSYVFQSYIVDSAKGISAPTGLNVPDGTWIVGVKVNDDATWQEIQSGRATGFSVEGIFGLFETGLEISMHSDNELDRIIAELEEALEFVKSNK